MFAQDANPDSCSLAYQKFDEVFLSTNVSQLLNWTCLSRQEEIPDENTRRILECYGKEVSILEKDGLRVGVCWTRASRLGNDKAIIHGRTELEVTISIE